MICSDYLERREGRFWEEYKRKIQEMKREVSKAKKGEVMRGGRSKKRRKKSGKIRCLRGRMCIMCEA